MLLVGTYALTKKKSRTADDFPFAKLSNGALQKVKCGWKRVARWKIVLKPNGRLPLYTVQATVWKDKKTSRISSQPSREGYHGPYCLAMVEREEDATRNFKSPGDYGLLLPHEWSQPQRARYCGLDSVTKMQPILLADLLLAF
jgi:hypothetical protein